MDAFLSTMARMATGSLQGKAQATQDYQQEQEKQQAQSQALLLAKFKQEAEREASVRKDAFEYAGSIQKVLENPDNLKYAQDNNLLPQFGREIQNGMDVAAGRTHYRRWNPQFAFSDQPSQPGAAGAAATTTPLTAPPVTPALSAQVTGMTPALSEPLPAPSPAAGAGSLFGAGPAAGAGLGPVAPPPAPATMPAPPVTPPQRTAFALTPKQAIDERQITETEAAGRGTREEAAARQVLAKKEFNLKVATAQIEHDMDTAKFRQSVGLEADKSATQKWEKLLDLSVDYLKSGGSTDQTAKAIKALLSVPNALGGRVPNATAIREFFTRSGVRTEVIEKILQDPAMGASGMSESSNTQPGTTSEVGGGVDISRGVGLQTPARIAGVGTGGPPTLPATGGAAPTDAQVQAALAARSRSLRGGVTANRGATTPEGTAPTVPLKGKPHAIASIAGMTPEAQGAAQQGFQALADAGIDFTVNSTARSHEEQQRMWKDRKKNPYPVAPPGSSTHEAGVAMDLTSRTGSQADLARVLEPLGWKWAGSRDPVHFTYVGAGTAQVAGATAVRGHAGQTLPVDAATGRVIDPTTGQPFPQPARPAGKTPTAASTGAPGAAPTDQETLAASLAAVGVKTPATAAPVVNPYPKGTLGQLILESLMNGQQTPEGLIDQYRGQPEKQKVVQEVAERYKGMQAGNLMPGIPTPSLEGAEVPTQAGIGSLANLYYNEPEVGKPNITTEPVESTPLSGRQTITQRKGEPSREGTPSGAGGVRGPAKPADQASGGGGTVAQPVTPKPVPKPAPKPPAKPTSQGGPNLLAVPPPPHPGPNLLTTGEGPQEKPKLVFAGRGPILPGMPNERLRNLLLANERLQKQAGKTGAGTRLAQQVQRLVGRKIQYNPRTGAIIDPTTGTELRQGQPHQNAGASITPGWFVPQSGPPLTSVPPEEKPNLVSAGRGPVIDFSRGELQAMQGDLRAYASSPYRKGIDQWLQQNKLDSIPNRHFYFDYIHRHFVPNLIRSGIPPEEVVRNLPHYLRANQSFGRPIVRSARS